MLQAKVEKALQILREHPFMGNDGLYLGHSGGKDSVVIADLVRLAFGSLPTIHNCKAETHPDTMTFLETTVLDVMMVAPEDMIPTLGRLGLTTQVDGTRKAEFNRTDGRSTNVIIDGQSVSREQMGHYVKNGLFGLNFIFPIFDWSDAEVWEYIHTNGLRVSPEYERILIVAPHPDDEVIGCYQTLHEKGSVVDVLYLHDTTPERMAEAQAASEYFGFNVANPEVKPWTYSSVYVPSRKDWHAQHKQAYRDYRKWATHFYSVDMVDGSPLSEENQRNKRKALDLLYPSQATLWERDHRYFLFESVTDKDYTLVRSENIFGVEVTAPTHALDAALSELQAAFPENPNADLFVIDTVIDTVMKHSGSAKVVFYHPTFNGVRIYE